MGSPSHYQPLRTSLGDDQLRTGPSSSIPCQNKCRTKCKQIMLAVSLCLTASLLGWVGYFYLDRQSLLLENDAKVYAARPVPLARMKFGGSSIGSISSKPHLLNKHPALPNPNLFGNFFDQLKPSEKTRYVTAVPLGGINNQMTGTYNLINLGRISSRTVILPPIIPNEHQPSSVKGRPYSRYYDISRLAFETGINLVEWNQLRNRVPDSETGEYAWTKRYWKSASNPLTCWVASNMGGLKEDGGRPITTRFSRALMLDVQPQYAPGDRKKGSWRSMAAAVKFIATNASAVSVGGVSKDVACLTESYWLDSPNSVKDTKSLIKSLRFNEWLESIVDELLARTLSTSIQQIKSGKAKFITVHLRRNDIASKCQPAPNNWKALAPVEYNSLLHKRKFTTPTEPLEEESDRSLFKRKADWTSCHFTDSYVISRVNAFRKSLHQPNIPVILTTDDTNPKSLALFDAQTNWHRFNLANFAAHDVYDGFDAVMIDACLLTRGLAFLGTRVSMMSRLAAHRGRAWYSRPAEIF